MLLIEELSLRLRGFFSPVSYTLEASGHASNIFRVHSTWTLSEGLPDAWHYSKSVQIILHSVHSI